MRNKTSGQIKDSNGHFHDFERGSSLKGLDFSGVEFPSKEFRNVDFSGANLSGAIFPESSEFYCCNFVGANLSRLLAPTRKITYCCFIKSDLYFSHMSCCDFTGSKFNEANLRASFLSCSNLSYCTLRNADLTDCSLDAVKVFETDFSGCKGFRSVQEVLANFEFTKSGCLIGYKTFNSSYAANPNWDISEGAVITENVNPDIFSDCGCGINIAPMKWVKENCNISHDIWKVRVSPKDLLGAVVPYISDGKIRVPRCTLLEIVH